MRGSKIKEHTCPACNGTGFPIVMQPVQPGRKIYPVKCKSCHGKGKITELTRNNPPLVELGLRAKASKSGA
jgi:DnaJ-class molecular chaperone